MKIGNIIRKYKIYIILSFVFVLIRVMPYSIGDIWDEAINDIAIGGFASALVAFIIKIDDDITLEKRNSAMGCRALYPLYVAIAEYMDTLVRCLCIQDKSQSKTNIYTLESWNSIIEESRIKFDSVSMETIIFYIDQLEKQAKNIIYKQDWFVAEKILDVNIINTIKNISTIYAMRDILLTGDQGTNNLLSYNQKLIDCLKNDPETEKFVYAKYGFTDRVVNIINSKVMIVDL